MKRLTRILLPAAAVMISTVAARADDLSVAMVGPITGQYAAFGEQMRRGAEMAVQDINAKGG
ncbi:MAG TPA: ABC transporter substrate-binding protein, partial [Stellaceae bacterium]